MYLQVKSAYWYSYFGGINSLVNFGSAITNKVISIDPDMLIIETGTITDGFTKISGYHWVNPYYRSDGTFVRGHMRGNPDGYCWNNLGGC